MDLSVIIPFVAEMPALAFTIQTIINDLEGFCDYEILAIDNAVESTKESEHKEENGSKFLMMRLEGKVLPNVRLLSYSEKLSHWNAKNIGISQSSGDALLFIDAHCIPFPGTLRHMLTAYQSLQSLCSLHLPLAYLLDQQNQLGYSLVSDLGNGILGYKFSQFNPKSDSNVTEVPCMSTCGMMISRSLLVDRLGMWPSELGVYSGGEHYLNFTMALLGHPKYILHTKSLHHYAAPRGYSLSWYDIYRNRAIATYLFGGDELFERFIRYHMFNLPGKVSPRAIRQMRFTVPNIPELQDRRRKIESNSVVSLDNWVKRWTSL